MGATPTTRYFFDRIKRFRRPFLLLAIVTVALFVMVPQMALVDTDNDGITDLSAIAIGATHIAGPSGSKRKDDRPQNSHTTVALALVATQLHHLEADESDCVSHNGRSILQSFCSLRC